MQRTAFWFSLVLVLVLSSTSQLQAQAEPIAIPPQLNRFDQYDENLATISVVNTYIAYTPVTVTRVNAAGTEEKEVTLVAEVREELLKYLLAEMTIKTVGGKELDRKEAAKQLKKGQPIILVSVSSKLPATYKGLFRDDAIILEVKALGTTPDLDGVKPAKP